MSYMYYIFDVFFVELCEPFVQYVEKSSLRNAIFTDMVCTYTLYVHNICIHMFIVHVCMCMCVCALKEEAKEYKGGMSTSIWE